jgi:endonuclease VIII
MPEGDTIFRAARALHRALAGHRVVQFESVFPALTRVHEDSPLTQQSIDAVSAAGKHLLIRFSEGLVLRTHMRMNGSWHLYRPGEPWQRPRRDMRVLVATTGFVAVGFNIPVAEFVKSARLHRHADLARLGPDLLAGTFDAAEAVRRLRGHAGIVSDAILDQRVMAGAGNVFKSEVLFACRVNPFTPVAHLDEPALATIVAATRRLLNANVSPGTVGRRTTGRLDPRERLWVYGRAGRPCRRCGTPIQSRRHGPAARRTYWCPACQPGVQA